MTDDNLRNYLEWLVSPQDANEQKIFKEEGLIDTYISIMNRIPSMNRSELIKEINIQLQPYGTEINENGRP